MIVKLDELANSKPEMLVHDDLISVDWSWCWRWCWWCAWACIYVPFTKNTRLGLKSWVEE